jgi:hypothetical protein
LLQFKRIYIKDFLGIGDWGLGIGDWAQSPIPNPQSPIPNPHLKKNVILFNNITIELIINNNKNEFQV